MLIITYCLLLPTWSFCYCSTCATACFQRWTALNSSEQLWTGSSIPEVRIWVLGGCCEPWTLRLLPSPQCVLSAWRVHPGTRPQLPRRELQSPLCHHPLPEDLTSEQGAHNGSSSPRGTDPNSPVNNPQTETENRGNGNTSWTGKTNGRIPARFHKLTN